MPVASPSLYLENTMSLRLRIAGVLLALPFLACGSSDESYPSSSDAGASDARDDRPGVDANVDSRLDDADDESDGQDAAPLVPTEREVLIPLDGQVLFPVRLDGATESSYLVIDTGAVRSAFEETLLRDVKNGVGVVTVDFGDGIVFDDYEVLAADLTEAEDHIGVAIDGLIGQDLFQQLYFGIDYRRARAIVARTPPQTAPAGWSEAERQTIPYELEQGYPIVTIDVDGTPARLIADTGSGVTLLTESHVPPAWLDTGLGGYVWHTSYGSDEATIVRIPTLSVGDVPVADSWAVIVPDDHHLSAVFSAIGLQIDGFLGYPAYRTFYWGIRGGESAYEVFPQKGEDPWTATEWNRVGVELVSSDNSVLIDMLFQPSSAQDTGLMVGDGLVSVDGTAVDGMALDDVRRMLQGNVGESRTLDILHDGAPKQVSVEVDDLLPTID